jgi:hypothetical protein
MRTLLLMAMMSTALTPIAAETPHEAVQEFAMARNIDAIVQRLPEELRRQVVQMPAFRKQQLVSNLLLAPSLERAQVELLPLPGPPDLLAARQPGRRSEALVRARRWLSDGVVAFFRLDVCMVGRCDRLGEMWLQWEDGIWRIIEANLWFAGRSVRFSREEFASQLSAPVYAQNEESAVGALRTINTAAVTYMSTWGIGFPRSLTVMAKAPEEGEESDEEHAGLISTDFAEESPVWSGYRFEYRQTTENSYEVYARPLSYEQTGKRSFFTDETGIIRWTDGDRRASVEDDPLR